MPLRVEQVVKCPYCNKKDTRIVHIIDEFDSLRDEVDTLKCSNCHKPFKSLASIKVKTEKCE
ncbi:hypothetical protein G9F73_012685 [Clostridium estertheticum]|uniref:hypothetical protein n=1 Tax=Clostridium estertheticum TaxID=238834 RepID=UPI0013EE5E43|nr:hypothetical protein [Clostridium estertheticum]MBZ9608665.1 hypothetical protein [Clostridium estertheticum]